MSYSLNGSSGDDRVANIRSAYRRDLNRFFIVFAVLEGALLALTALLVFVSGLVDPEQGVWLFLVIAFLGGLAMSGYLFWAARKLQRDIRDVTGR